MSKGSPRVTIRVPQRVLDLIVLEIAKQNDFSPRGTEDLSLFIVRAIEERISKRQRSRKTRPRPARASTVAWPEERVELTKLWIGGYWL